MMKSLFEMRIETDLTPYLGRLVQVRREGGTAGSPGQLATELSLDYEYDAVGNIRDAKVVSGFSGHPAITNRTDYFTYDENNRMLINKGQLLNGATNITFTQGSLTAYDEAGNIRSSDTYEGGFFQYYTSFQDVWFNQHRNIAGSCVNI